MLSVTMSGLDTAIARMATRAALVQDVSAPLEAARQAFGRVEDQHFVTAGSGTWAANTERTARFKAQLGFGGAVMTRTGTLRASLADPEVFEATPTSVVVGTAVPYARFHQTGFRQVWRLEEGINGQLLLRRAPSAVFQAPRRPIDLAASGTQPITDAFGKALLAALESA